MLIAGWDSLVATANSTTLAAAHAVRGWHAHELGRDAEARDHLGAALALYQRLGDGRMVRALRHDLEILVPGRSRRSDQQ
jgi:hypothetical protein